MSQLSMDILVDSIYEFIKSRYADASVLEIKGIIEKHIRFGTCDVIVRDDKIKAVVRWNVTQDGLVFDILDLFIAPGESGIRTIRHFVARNWGRFLTVKYIRFARVLKYPNRGWRVYRIEDILKLRRKV